MRVDFIFPPPPPPIEWLYPGLIHVCLTATIQVDYWIIATDYEHYSLVYGCTIPEQGVCMRAHAWMWSRQRVPEEKYYSIMKSHLPQLCLNESDFKILTQTFGKFLFIKHDSERLILLHTQPHKGDL